MLEAIWEGDRLSRQHDASLIERYLIEEAETFKRLGRDQSIVLGIDSPYGFGKSWFIDRLAKQLALTHPVARIDAWADDAGDEPLTAFMAAIDDALKPYLSRSKKLSDRMSAVKASALPVMGKLVSGALTKALTKVAGDEIEDQLGDVVERALGEAKDDAENAEDGAASLAMEAALERIGAEIDTLVDRRGAAMLAAYHQRKKSRETFRRRMSQLISAIDAHAGGVLPPLIVIVDELDRCRPTYAIKVLEEIKHFFEVTDVVFIIGLYGEQLARSVNAIYGPNFDSSDYLRRFFTRKYFLRRQSVVELCAETFETWGIDCRKFAFPEFSLSDGYAYSEPRAMGLILAQWEVSPREVLSIMDGLRLFAGGWEHPDPIEPIAILSLLVQMVRGQELNFVQPKSLDHILVKGWSADPNSGERTRQNFSVNAYLANLSPLAWNRLSDIGREQPNKDAARNYLVEWLQTEWRTRVNRSPNSPPHQSHITDYIPRVWDIARFVD